MIPSYRLIAKLSSFILTFSSIFGILCCSCVPCIFYPAYKCKWGPFWGYSFTYRWFWFQPSIYPTSLWTTFLILLIAFFPVFAFCECKIKKKKKSLSLVYYFKVFDISEKCTREDFYLLFPFPMIKYSIFDSLQCVRSFK